MKRLIPLIASPPFNPMHDGLYTPEELLSGYTSAQTASITQSLDYRCFIYFQQQGRTVVNDPFAGMVEAMHDASVARGMNTFVESHLANGRRPVAIMGGHREARGSPTYRAVAKIAKDLSERDFLVASGGGPGCMEASHLGALFANATMVELDAAIAELATQAELPAGMTSVLTQDKDSKQWSIDDELAKELARWIEPARRIADSRKQSLGIANQSLAVPTWHYGHEPFTPLATHVAKYFLNSIREDVLLALATAGIVYAEGRGGTLQEVFQDAAQIYYREQGKPITSMIFYNSGFWSAPAKPDGKPHLPVKDLLHALFVNNNKMTQAEFDRYICLEDEPAEIVRLIVANAAPIQQVVEALNGIGMGRFSLPQLTEASARALDFPTAP